MAKQKRKKSEKTFSKDEIEFQYKTSRNNNIATVLSQLINNGLKYGTYIVLIVYSYKAIVALSGKTTIANIIFSLIADLGVKNWIAYTVAILAIAYGVAQKHLRRKNIKEKGQYITELKSSINAKRLSSGLAETGETNSRDL